ncbi:hypothetical protein EW145_g8011 [Phellinidium pouzarii]|uniref:Uncharacterized protein n=1 Tax=Phellinidium pouzarii TaxID=167371 RepID=A0A4S4KB03_9AGAM|nr:hypothetical protein EW145_g8011 [Phellinidium pouzarii]
MSVVTVTLRRFLRTSPPYVRRVATSAAADIFAQSPLSKGVEAATTLQDFMREAADVHDYTQQENEQKPTLIAFQSQAVVRPIDMHREFVRKYPETEHRPTTGGGQPEADERLRDAHGEDTFKEYDRTDAAQPAAAGEGNQTGKDDGGDSDDEQRDH